MNNEFQVNIITLDQGLIEIKNAQIIRIKSKDYNLLIMKDYLPIIGMIEGSFEVISTKEEFKMENTIAYYINANNLFRIIVKEENYG